MVQNMWRNKILQLVSTISCQGKEKMWMMPSKTEMDLSKMLAITVIYSVEIQQSLHSFRFETFGPNEVDKILS